VKIQVQYYLTLRQAARRRRGQPYNDAAEAVFDNKTSSRALCWDDKKTNLWGIAEARGYPNGKPNELFDHLVGAGE
jgi:hypothetical protein